eukprot:gene24490-30841_t
MLHSLGHRHIAYGASAKSFPLVGDALLLTLEQYIGEQWTAETKVAWTKAYGLIVDMMLAGMVKGADGDATSKKPAGSSAVASTSTANKTHTTARWNIGLAKLKHLCLKPLHFVQSLLQFAVNEFWRASWSNVCIVVVILYFAITHFFDQHSLIVRFINELDNVSMVLGMVLYVKEAPDRKRQSHYTAWSTIDSAHGKRRSQARFMAMQDLNADSVNMRGIECSDVDLADIQLYKSNIQYGNFSCDLSRAVFSDSNLERINMEGVKANGADFSRCNLSFAHFQGAMLNNVDFTCANLMCTDFTSATLTNANLRGANLTGAKLD